MSQDAQIRFRTATRGYNKEDVNQYISKISINFQSVEQSLKSAINQLHQELESQKELLAAQRDTLLQQSQLLLQMETLQAANKRNESALSEAKRIIDRKNQELADMRNDVETLRSCCLQVCQQMESLQKQAPFVTGEVPPSSEQKSAQLTNFGKTPGPIYDSASISQTEAQNDTETTENMFDTLMQQLHGNVDSLCRRAASYDAQSVSLENIPSSAVPPAFVCSKEHTEASQRSACPASEGEFFQNHTSHIPEAWMQMSEAVNDLRAQCEKITMQAQTVLQPETTDVLENTR